jgi:co-chaperonin GroES (HSP10)
VKFLEQFRVSPNSDRVLVEADGIEDRKIGSIVIPNAAGERTRLGTVLAVGPEVKSFAAGDRVMFNVYTGINVYAPKYDELDEKLKIFRAEEILATVTPK